MNPKTLNQISKHIAVCAQCNQSYFEVAAKNLPQTLFSAINKVTCWSILIVKQAVEAAFHPAVSLSLQTL